MTIRSLLLGSVAALATVSGAQAADAIVAAEPEPMDYVRVCDAFGTGYFYLPGSETCLKVGGYLRYEVQWNDRHDDENWNARMRAVVAVSTKTETELGTLGSVIDIRSWAESDYGNSREEIGTAIITLGGFQVGYAYNWWDNDLSGETDDLGSNRLNQIGYTYKGNNVTAGLFVDELTKRYSQSGTTYDGNDNIGVESQLTFSYGPVSAWLLGAYDAHEEDGSVRLITTTAIGPGDLSVAGLYSSGANAYYDLSEWTVAVEYAAKITDRLSITPGFQYWNNTARGTNADFNGGDAWRAGVTLDYKIVDGLTSKFVANYTDVDGAEGDWAYDTGWTGFVRLQRNF